jgi:hypothetical protein
MKKRYSRKAIYAAKGPKTNTIKALLCIADIMSKCKMSNPALVIPHPGQYNPVSLLRGQKRYIARLPAFTGSY